MFLKGSIEDRKLISKPTQIITQYAGSEKFPSYGMFFGGSGSGISEYFLFADVDEDGLLDLILSGQTDWACLREIGRVKYYRNIGAKRSPMGRFLGSLSPLTAPEIGLAVTRDPGRPLLYAGFQPLIGPF